MPLFRLPLLLGLVAACANTSEPQVEPGVTVQRGGLDPLADFGIQRLEGAERIERMRYAPAQAIGFAIDPAAGRVHLVDEYGRHSGERLCVDPALLRVEDPSDGAWQEDCAAGEVALHRGYVEAEAPVDVAVDPEADEAWVVGAGGELRRVELDLLADSPLAWLRADPPIQTGLQGLRSAVWAEGALWLATDQQLHRIEDGKVQQSLEVAGAELLSGDGGLWWLADGELRGPGERSEPAERAAVAAGRAVWWSEGELSSDLGWSLPMPEPPEQLALSPTAGVIWVLANGRLHRLSESESWTIEQPGDRLLLSPSGDVWVAQGAELHRRFDERALADPERAPLYLSSLTALEDPSQYDQPIECGGPDSIGARLERAERSWQVLEALPGRWGVAISARFAEGVHQCGEEAALAPWREREPGLMLHQPTGCAEEDCYREAVGERAGQLWSLGLEPTWATAFHGEAVDWVGAVRELGIDRYLLFGAGIHPQLLRGDLRTKQAWPLRPGEGTAAFRLRSVEGLPPLAPPFLLPSLVAGCRPEARDLSLYPGHNRAAFSQDGCAGLLYLECVYLERNSGFFGEEDLRVLALSLRHALARRSTAPSSWSWHLADLGSWDYTAGCAWEQGALVGECEAQYILKILEDIDSMVQAGLARWSGPSRLPRP